MHIGIDLGTTNSLIAAFQDGTAQLIPNALGSVLTPSVVALKDGHLVVGETARAILLTHPTSSASVFKRAMGTDRVFKLGGKEFSAPELSAIVLKALKEDAEAYLGMPVTDVVISVPAYFNELQRKAVRAAGQIAGLNVTRLINEPTAAALAYGLHETRSDDGATGRILVFDLGGGTFDISILDLFEGVMEVRASAGDAFLGGEDFTEHLARYIAQQSVLDVNDMALRPGLLSLAEAAKRAMTNENSAKITAELGDKHIDMALTRDRFEEICGHLMARLSAPLDRAIADSGFRIEQLDKVILVGGATRMPMIRAYVARKLRQFPAMGLDPDHVVALGAAVQAGLVANDKALDDVVMTDVSAFTLGVEAGHTIGGNIKRGYYAPIIERNSVIPISREEVFQTMQLGQTEIELGIYQGEAPIVMNNLYLGEARIRVPRNMKEHEKCRVRFTYDVSGLLEVNVTAVSTGEVVTVVIEKLAGEMSKADIASALKKMAAIKTHPRDDAANIHLRARIEAVYAMTRDEARTAVTDLLLQLDHAIERQDPIALSSLRTELHALLDQFEAHYVQ